MTVATVSSKYHLVIPKNIRAQIALKPGQKVEVMAVGGTIFIVPVRSIASLRSAFPGIATEVH